MTRGELIIEALDVFDSATDKLAQAYRWLNTGLREIETYGMWKFLETEGTLTLTEGDDDVAFTESKWDDGASALTNYSKGLKLFRASFGALRQFASRTAFDNARGTAASSAPTHFYPGNDIVFLFPDPPATPGTLKYSYYKQIAVPTADTDDLFTVCNLKVKHQTPLINYIRYRLFEETQTVRAAEEYVKWENALKRMFAEEGVGVGAAASMQPPQIGA